jgi:glutathione S-transferase
MPQYKLYYFPLRARAEAIRLVFHYKGIPFEDVRIPRDEWESKKSGKFNLMKPQQILLYF